MISAPGVDLEKYKFKIQNSKLLVYCGNTRPMIGWVHVQLRYSSRFVDDLRFPIPTRPCDIRRLAVRYPIGPTGAPRLTTP